MNAKRPTRGRLSYTLYTRAELLSLDCLRMIHLQMIFDFRTTNAFHQYSYITHYTVLDTVLNRYTYSIQHIHNSLFKTDEPKMRIRECGNEQRRVCAN